MKITRNLFRRPAALVSALALLVAGAAPVLTSTLASAVAQVTTRSIQMSSSAPSATGVTYNVTFTPQTSVSGGLGALIIDFCSDSPIIGASCAFATTSVPNVASAAASTGTLTTVGSGTPVHTVKVTGLTFVAGTPYNFQLTNMSNQSANGTFYARILTYATAANAGGYVPANTTGGTTTTGTYADYGGDAMAVNNQISISATVQEQLTFCVSGATMTAGCAGMTTPNLTLGSGSPVTLGTTLSSAPAYTQTSTNALTGVVVRMKNSNSCGGLSRDGGTTCALAPAGASPATIGTGSGLFGMYVTPGGSTTASTAYAGGTTQYGMDNTTANNNVSSTYGSSIFTSTGALSNENDTLTYGAAAATTTPAGVYTATMNLIATGTF